MRNRVKIASSWLIVLSVLLPAVTAQTKPPDMEGRNRAVAALKLFRAAEIDFFHANSRYATFQQLVNFGQLEQTANQSSDKLSTFNSLNLTSDTDAVSGFTLALVVPKDGKSYKFSLTQKEKCGFSLLTDESGSVFESRVEKCNLAEPAAPVDGNWVPPEIEQKVPAAESSQACPLTQILQKTSARVQELGDNLQQFSAKERIEHIEIGKNGKPRNTASGSFDYVAQIHHEDTGHTYVEEYRLGPSALESTPLADTGTAAFALIFHPRHIDEFAMQCEGQTAQSGRTLWQLRFAQRDDRPNDFHAFRVKGSTYHVKLKGRAWIDADNYEVVRLETDLMEPIKDIDLRTEHMVIDYAPVDFPKHKVQLWLPENAELYVDYRGQRYERKHTFSDFQLFSVETAEKVKEPVDKPQGSSGFVK